MSETILADESGLTALAHLFVDDATFEETLLRLAELANAAASSDGVALTLLVDGKVVTAVCTDDAVRALDEAQYLAGSGPCLEAFRDGQMRRIDATARDASWPEFSRAACEAGIASTLSLPVVARDEPLGALNFYFRRLGAFAEDHEALDLFAARAAVVLANGQRYWESRALSEHLSDALESRATIDQAIGIILSQGGRSPTEAFEVLVRASQRENRKLREIAAEMVERAVGRRSPPA